jgi:lipid II:glycine glycyltransferase (peptidoglycan interpeptide bridge formation enzyme)
MDIVYTDPVNDERWLTFISQNPKSNIFHHPSWLQTLRQQYGYKISAICKTRNDAIVAGLPFAEISNISNKKKWVALPFSDYCNPLFTNEKDVLDLLREIIVRYKEKNIDAAEVNFKVDCVCGFSAVENSYLHLLEIKSNEEEMMKSFDRTKRQGIAKALKQELEVELSTKYSAVESFFNLHLMVRRAKGVPVQPKGFFKAMHKNVIESGNGFIILVKKNGIDIAAGLFMHYNNVLTYKYNASHADYLQLRPNNLIIWRALQEGITRGFKVLDFGKSDFDNEGLRSFKKGWGATEYINTFSYYPYSPVHETFSYVKDKIVAPIIRKTPSFVCQFLGEVAYKFFPSI